MALHGREGTTEARAREVPYAVHRPVVVAVGMVEHDTAPGIAPRREMDVPHIRQAAVPHAGHAHRLPEVVRLHRPRPHRQRGARAAMGAAATTATTPVPTTAALRARCPHHLHGSGGREELAAFLAHDLATDTAVVPATVSEQGGEQPELDALADGACLVRVVWLPARQVLLKLPPVRCWGALARAVAQELRQYLNLAVRGGATVAVMRVFPTAASLLPAARGCAQGTEVGCASAVKPNALVGPRIIPVVARVIASSCCSKAGAAAGRSVARPAAAACAVLEQLFAREALEVTGWADESFCHVHAVEIPA